jgi:hypothetical protein
MFKSNSKDGFSLKAYQGSEMTLLAMDIANKPADGTFAGFSLYYTNPKGKRYPIQNMINFQGTDEVTGSNVSPIQLFKWVHFPGSYQQTGMLSGKYIYEAVPRYLTSGRELLKEDLSKAVKVDIDVNDFADGHMSVGFTRAFVKSQAFANRYGVDQKLVPSGDWVFDTSINAGTNPKYGKFSYEDMYLWLGFNARKMIIGMLEEALNDNNITVDMFAYDFNEPRVAQLCLDLAKKGRIRIILDNSSSHTGKNTKGKTAEEDDFETRFKASATQGSDIFRCRFSRYSHCKEVILSRNAIPYKVLTGSTNFSTTGFYINANHVVVFTDKTVAAYYSDVFKACWRNGKTSSFLKQPFADTAKKFIVADLPETEINVSPHSEKYANKLLDSISTNINSNKTTSVLFSVMEMGKKSTGSLISTLRNLHKNDSVFTYGVTDNSSGEISLYKPGRKNGLLVDAKKANRELPPPFDVEVNINPAHAIHHKFVVTNFNKSDARVYCGSSNFSLGGEKENGDNLLCIKDEDVATVFAIEAFRLTDHYNFRSKIDKADNAKAKGLKMKPVILDNTGSWVNKFYDKNDIRFVERKILA